MSGFWHMFPAAFPALALAHFVSLLSPGPDFLLIVGHGVRHRFRGTAFICLGIALGNVVYISLALAGWSGLRQYPLLFRILEVTGAVYLVWIGYKLWRSSWRPSELDSGSVRALGPGRQLAVGLGSALLNPKNMVFYLTLMTVIIGSQATLGQQTAAGIWMASVVLLWDLALAASLSLPGVRHVLEARIPLVERLAGTVLLIIAVALMVGPWVQ